MTTAESEQYSIVAFIPAIHKGYIDFLRKYPGTIYLLGPDFIADFPHIERDIRTPEMTDLKNIINSLGVTNDAIELTRKSILQLPTDPKIVMPDDSVTRAVAEKYLSGRDIIFDTTFLRWNKQISATEFIVPPGRTISQETLDKELLAQAFKESEKSSDWWRRIGVLAVKDGKILLTGFNSHLPSDFTLDSFGDPRSSFDAGERFDLSTAIHGEAELISKAAKNGIALDGATLYVTTFPCPACAKLIVNAGIKKVYYAQGYSLLDAEQILGAFGVELVLIQPE
jgi:dCMP deaminase